MANFTNPSSGGGNPDLNLIKTKRWGYPTPNSVAIIPATTGETIALKSSGGAQLRWHIRDTGRSVIDYQVNITSVYHLQYADYNGITYVILNIDPQDIPLPTGVWYGVNISTGNGDFAGQYQASDSTNNTITLAYNGDITGWDWSGVTGYLQLPSIYSEVQATDDGVYIKLDNWSQEPYDNNWWQFQRDGGLKFPDGSIQYGAAIGGTGAVTGDTFESSNNGNGTNFKVGDDAWIGDVNAANTISIKGVEDATAGNILFGSSSRPLGSDATEILKWGTNPVVTDVAVPTSHLGQAGDQRGQIATDSAYIYFCTQDFNGNGAAIWRRIATDPVWNW